MNKKFNKEITKIIACMLVINTCPVLALQPEMVLSNDSLNTTSASTTKSLGKSSRQVVTFPDKAVETAIRENISKPTGDLYVSDLLKVDGELRISSESTLNLSGLEYCTNIRRLHIYDAHVTDLTPIISLNNLNELYIGNATIDNAQVIGNLKKLTVLKINSVSLDSIDFLSNMSNLTNLQMFGCGLEDISALKNLTNLVELDLGNNNIRDISVLGSLTNLGRLTISTNKITDISSLQKLSKLTFIDMSHNLIGNIKPLGNVSSLRYLNANENYIDMESEDTKSFINKFEEYNQNTDHWSRFDYQNYIYNETGSNLTVVEGNSLSLNILRKQTRYTFGPQKIDVRDLIFSIEDTDIVDFDSENNLIGKKEGVTKILVSHLGATHNGSIELTVEVMNANEDIVYIPDANLEKVIREKLSKSEGNLYKSELQSITGTLSASSMGITNIEGLQYLTNISYLYLSSNNINDISVLSELTNLKELHLNYNHVANIDALKGLSKLTSLSLMRNPVSNLTAIADLNNLKTLNLECTYIGFDDATTEIINKFKNQGCNVKINERYCLTTEDGSNTINDIETNTIVSLPLVIKAIDSDGEITKEYVSTPESRDFIYTIEDTNIVDVDEYNNLIAKGIGSTNVNISHYGAGGLGSTNLTISVDSENDILGSATIKYIDKDTKEEIKNSKTISNLPLGRYSFKYDDIDGYEKSYSWYGFTLTKDNPNTTLVFKYTKLENPAENVKGSVTIKYLDENGDTVVAEEVKSDLDLGEHTYNAKEIEGYNVIGDTSKTVELTEDNPNQVITFTYKKVEVPVVKGSVTIKYLDENGDTVVAEEVKSDLDLGEHTYNAKEIEGYNVIGDTSKTVELTEDNPNQVITFTYKKVEVPVVKGSVTIKYLDESGKALATEEVKSDLDLGEYTYNAKSIEGYNIIGDLSKTVELTEDNPNQIITFTYKKVETPVVKGSVTIKYLDESGKALATEEVKSDLDLGEYTYNAKEIEGYNVIGDTSKTVELTEDNPNQVITFTYKKVETPVVKGSVTIKYLDEKGNVVATEEVKSDLELGSHTYSAKSIEGYTIVGNSSKTIELTEDNPNQVITFTYKKVVHVDVSDDKDEENEDNKNDNEANNNTVSASKNDIENALNQNKGIELVGQNAVISIGYDVLKKANEDLKEVTLTVVDKNFEKENIENLSQKYNLNIVDYFNVYSNLSLLDKEMSVKLGKSVDGKYNNQTLYLYRINTKSRSADIEFIGEYDSSVGFASYNLNAQLLDGSDFIISTNKRNINNDDNGDTDIDTDVDNGNNNNNNVNTGINVDSNDNNNSTGNNNFNSSNSNNDNNNSGNGIIPDTSGTNMIITTLSISSILSSLFLLKKKRKK